MTPTTRRRLILLLGMTGSIHEGERNNAISAANKLLQTEGASWAEILNENNPTGPQSDKRDHELKIARQEARLAGFQEGYRQGLRDGQHAPRMRPASWRGLAHQILRDHTDDISEWETGFLTSFVKGRWHSPSEKQRAIFERITDRLGLEPPEPREP